MSEPTPILSTVPDTKEEEKETALGEPRADRPNTLKVPQMTVPVNTERRGWANITPEDATAAELHLVHLISGEKPKWLSDEQWRLNMRACAKGIRALVALEKKEAVDVDARKALSDVITAAELCLDNAHWEVRYGSGDLTDAIQRGKKALVEPRALSGPRDVQGPIGRKCLVCGEPRGTNSACWTCCNKPPFRDSSVPEEPKSEAGSGYPKTDPNLERAVKTKVVDFRLYCARKGCELPEHAQIKLEGIIREIISQTLPSESGGRNALNLQRNEE